MKIKLFPSILILLPAFLIVQTVSAHGDDPRIEISPERLSPGAVLDIRGVDFEFEEVVMLSLVSSQTEIPFGEVLADVEGIFQLTITLPVDTPEGTYVIRATTDDHVVESPQIVIAGAAIVEGGGQGERDEDDGLLAPMPTFAPGVVSTPMPQAVVIETEAPEPSSSPLLLGAVAVVGLILVATYIRMKRR